MDTSSEVGTTLGRHRERLRRALQTPVKRVTIALLATLAGASVTGGSALAQERSVSPRLGDDPVLLSTLVRVALEWNRDVLEAEYEVAVAGEQVAEAWSNVYPSLDLSSSFTRNVAPQVSFLPAQIFNPNAAEGEFIPVQFGADNIWNLSLNAEQKLFDPRVFVGLGAAASFERVQREALRGRTQQAVTRMRMAFYDLLLGQEEVRLTENSLKRVRQSLDETRAMQEAGLSPVYDVLRLEVELANLEPNLRRARNRMEAAARELAVELAMDPETRFEVAGSLAHIDLESLSDNTPANRDILGFNGVPDVDEAEVAAFVRRNAPGRSDIRQLEMTRDLRHSELRIEQVEYLPKVFAFGTYGLAAQQNGSPDFFGSSASAVRRSRWTPGDHSRLLGVRTRRPNRSEAGRAAPGRDPDPRGVGPGGGTAAQPGGRGPRAHARAAGQRLAVGHAQRGYEIASAQYREGLGSQLELTDAEVALRQSEFNYAQAVYDYLAARARLDEAAGRVPMVDIDWHGAGEEGWER